MVIECGRGGIKAALVMFGLTYWVDGADIPWGVDGGLVGGPKKLAGNAWPGPRKDPWRVEGFEKRELASRPNQERLKTQ